MMINNMKLTHNLQNFTQVPNAEAIKIASYPEIPLVRFLDTFALCRESLLT